MFKKLKAIWKLITSDSYKLYTYKDFSETIIDSTSKHACVSDNNNQFPKYPHKYKENDLVIVDFKNGNQHEVKRLKADRLYNGAICVVKTRIPQLKESDSINYITELPNYTNTTCRKSYVLSENVIRKMNIEYKYIENEEV